LSGFNAGNVVDPLDFTLMPFVQCEGTIKEPTDAQISTFLASVKTLASDLRKDVPTLPENATQAQLLDAIDSLDPEIMLSMGKKMAVLYAALCSGKPSEEQLLALPPRIRNIFYAWLQEQVMDPEVVSGGGAPQANGQKR